MKKFLFDLFPVIMFFITLKVAEKTASASVFLHDVLTTLDINIIVKPSLVPIMLATIAVILATLIQVVWVKIRHGKVDKILWLSAVLVVILGCMTLYFQNDVFIKWKPTILYWVFSLILISAELFWNKNFIKSMMESNIQLPVITWRTLNFAWAAFFLFLGVLNLYVAFNYSLSTWASYKLFGTTAIMFVFIILQTLVLSKYLSNEDAK